jgi:hypothetical protein
MMLSARHCEAAFAEDTMITTGEKPEKTGTGKTVCAHACTCFFGANVQPRFFNGLSIFSFENAKKECKSPIQ